LSCDAQWDTGGHVVVVDGVRYVTPAPGRYSLGRFAFEGRSLAVLWSVESVTAWIDMKQNFYFEDEAPIRDVRRETPTVKLPSAQRPSGQAVSVVIRSPETLILYAAGHYHSTMTAGVAAGVPVGPISGLAPAARLVPT